MVKAQIEYSKTNLTLEGARNAIAACEKKANEIGVPMNIAVVDASLHLIAFARYHDS